jgi:hypothetical protein
VNLGEHKGDGIRHSMHLSAPKGGLAQMLRDPDGQWVPYADYAALKAENERLKTERDHYQWASINDGIACNERARENQDLENQIDALKAENERLNERLMYLEATRPRDPHHGGKMYEMPIDEEYYANLQLENERLRKAGDAMDAYLKRLDGTTNGMLDCRRAWLAAKGVQP